MAALIHLCRKDYSFAKHALWGAWAVFLVAALMPRLVSGALAEAAAPILGLLLAVQHFQIFASVLKILRADSYSGGHAFIGTRPVTKTTLWLSKLISIATFVLVPWLVAKAIAVIAAGVHPSSSDWAMLVCEEILWFGTVASVGLVVGTHTRQFAWTVLLTIALCACVLWLAVSVFNRPGGLNFITEARHLKASQWLVAQALITLSGLALSWLWITRRNPVISIATGGLLAALVFLGSKHWNINFIERLAAPQTTAKPRISWVGDPMVSKTSRNNMAFATVSSAIRVEGTPEGCIAFPAGVRSFACYADGTTHSGHTANSTTHGDATRALFPSLGEPPLTDNAWPMDPNRFTIFQGYMALARKKAGMPCTLRGEALVELHEPVVLANLPARSGESATSGRFRYHVERVAPTGPDQVAVDISVTGIRLSSRDDLLNEQSEIEMLLVNSRIGHHTPIGYLSGGSYAVPGWFSLRRVFPIDGRSVDDKIDPVDFLKDARLYLIGRRYRGTVRVPFEIPDVDLNSGR
jgi:hypothetical protein